MTPTDFVSLILCLACADRECCACYGESCECTCKGEETAGGALGCVYCDRATSVVDIPEEGGAAHYECWLKAPANASYEERL